MTLLYQTRADSAPSFLQLAFSPSFSPCMFVCHILSLACLLLLTSLWLTCRHLYKSASGGRGFLWPRPFGSLSVCLLEAVLAHLEEQSSVGSRGKWPPGGLPRSAPLQLPAGRRLQSGGGGEEVPAGSEGERPELCQAPGGGHEDQPDISRHSSRGANGPEGEAEPAGEDPEADHGADVLLQVLDMNTLQARALLPLSTCNDSH